MVVMRLSFSMTIPQMETGAKTVTRRIDASKRIMRLQPGAVVEAVDKLMGLRKGERSRVIGRIEVVSVRREPVCLISAADVEREGFPGMTPDEFVAMFCRAMRCDPNDEVTRLEFRHLSRWPRRCGNQECFEHRGETCALGHIHLDMCPKMEGNDAKNTSR